jgi:hypothetical protein
MRFSTIESRSSSFPAPPHARTVAALHHGDAGLARFAHINWQFDSFGDFGCVSSIGVDGSLTVR